VNRAAAFILLILLAFGADVAWAMPGEIRDFCLYAPKDFTILKIGDWYHAVAIRTRYNKLWMGTGTFGHYTSLDLMNWTLVETWSAAQISTPELGLDDIWAPTIVAANGRYIMYFTAIKNVGSAQVQKLVAVEAPTISPDAGVTVWSNPTQVIDCNHLSVCDGTPWAGCADGQGFRDPFVMRSPDASGPNSGWLAYWVTATQAYGALLLVGSARAPLDTPTVWQDRGPLSATHFTYALESPHLIDHNGSWYMFFTQLAVGTIRFITGPDPLSSACDGPSTWSAPQPVPVPITNIDFASETYSETYADGTRDDYFAAVHDDSHVCPPFARRIQIREIRWQPGQSPPFRLIDPLEVTAMSFSGNGLDEAGSTDTLKIQVGVDDPEDHTAHLEVYEVDGDVRTRIPATSIGLPDPVLIPAHTPNLAVPFTCRFFADDDATPGQLEIVVRYRGVETPGTLIIQDTTPPAPVTALSITLMFRKGAQVRWPAPGDGAGGGVASYDLRCYPAPLDQSNFAMGIPISAPAPAPEGTLQTACVDVLDPYTSYWFALKSTDQAGNVSLISNEPHGITMGSGTASCDNLASATPPPVGGGRRGGVTFAPVRPTPCTRQAVLSYSVAATLEGAGLELSVYDVLGRRVRTLQEGAAEAGPHSLTWDLRGPDGGRVRSGIYFARLAIGGRVMLTQTLLVTP